jgi:hypothetical protein
MIWSTLAVAVRLPYLMLARMFSCWRCSPRPTDLAKNVMEDGTLTALGLRDHADNQPMKVWNVGAVGRPEFSG